LPIPKADFSTSNPACSPLTINLINNSSNYNYLWDFGDGTATDTARTPSHTFVNDTTFVKTFTVKLVVSSFIGCSDTAIQYQTVYPLSNYKINAKDSICNENLLNLFTIPGANTYQWDFGDGNTLAGEYSVTHNYVNTQSTDTVFTASLITTNYFGCKDTTTKQIVINPKPTAAFNAQVTASDAFTVEINNSSQNATIFAWEFGDGSSSTDDSGLLQHTYPEPSISPKEYTIQLIVQNNYGCSDTLIQKVSLIYPPPVADFDSSFQGCVPLTVTFINKTKYANSYQWDFGDGSTSTQSNAEHTYTETGAFRVSLTATGVGGQSVATPKTVTVHEKPVVNFNVNPYVVILPDQAITTENLSENGVSYLWNFGDTTTSTEENPRHIYTIEGTYYITLTVTTDKQCVVSYTNPQGVEVRKGGEMTFPTAFIPNTSGPNGGNWWSSSNVNEIFHPLSSGVMDYHLYIYNRWGELVFVSNDIKIGWDGYYRGTLCKQDVYIWKAEGHYSNLKQFSISGDVLLLR